jgi:CTP:phosphocholine cytidylyltransferase-like protein
MVVSSGYCKEKSKKVQDQMKCFLVQSKKYTELDTISNHCMRSELTKYNTSEKI